MSHALWSIFSSGASPYLAAVPQHDAATNMLHHNILVMSSGWCSADIGPRFPETRPSPNVNLNSLGEGGHLYSLQQFPKLTTIHNNIIININHDTHVVRNRITGSLSIVVQQVLKYLRADFTVQSAGDRKIHFHSSSFLHI